MSFPAILINIIQSSKLAGKLPGIVHRSTVPQGRLHSVHSAPSYTADTKRLAAPVRPAARGGHSVVYCPSRLQRYRSAVGQAAQCRAHEGVCYFLLCDTRLFSVPLRERDERATHPFVRKNECPLPQQQVSTSKRTLRKYSKEKRKRC